MSKPEDGEKKVLTKKLKDLEVSVPMFYGNIALWLGKKANEYHHLRLYPDDDSGPTSTKKPVVAEFYDEIVFPEPSEGFLARVQNHPAVTLPRSPAGLTLPPPVPVEDINKRKRDDTKEHPLSQWFMTYSEADELLELAAGEVQAHIAKLKRQISLIDGPLQQPKSTSGQ